MTVRLDSPNDIRTDGLPLESAADTVSVSPDVAHQAVIAMSSRFVRPASTVDEILDHLIAHYDMIEAVELIRGVR